MPQSYNEIAGRSVERLAALSDGLLAIAITLLIIELHAPASEAIHSEGELWRAITGLAPQLLMYLMGFLTLGIFSVGQQTQLNLFQRTDRDLTWIHIGFLAAAALMPFSTALVAAFITYRVALFVYWLNLLFLGIALCGSWACASRAGLLKDAEDMSRATRRRIVAFQLFYAAGFLLSFISTYLVHLDLSRSSRPISPLPSSSSCSSTRRSRRGSAGCGGFEGDLTPTENDLSYLKEGIHARVAGCLDSYAERDRRSRGVA
jgi:uncharacterized membrane protein